MLALDLGRGPGPWPVAGRFPRPPGRDTGGADAEPVRAPAVRLAVCRPEVVSQWTGISRSTQRFRAWVVIWQ